MHANSWETEYLAKNGISFLYAISLTSVSCNLPSILLRISDENVTNVVGFAARLAGKYVVFYANKTGLYIIPDATASLPVYYSTQRNAICVSSCDNLVNSLFGYGISKRALDVRLGSDLSQPLPYNMTLYDEIKCLLPNHYIDILRNDVVRYAPSLSKLNLARE